MATVFWVVHKTFFLIYLPKKKKQIATNFIKLVAVLTLLNILKKATVIELKSELLPHLYTIRF